MDLLPPDQEQPRAAPLPTVSPATSAAPRPAPYRFNVPRWAMSPMSPMQTPGAAPRQPNAPTQTGAPAPQAQAAPAGSIITSSAGDGFGSPPVGGGPANAPAPQPQGGATPMPLVDRFALAQDRWNQYAASSEPAYQSALRQANRLGAAGGQLGAGDLRTNFGNLADARGRDLTTQGRGFLSDALEGTIGDNQRAFQNELSRLGLSDELTNSAFGRALQAYGAGNANNPTNTGLAVGGYQAANAARSGQGWTDLVRNLGLGSGGGAGSATPLPPLPAPGAATNNTGAATSELPAWLRAAMGAGMI